MSQPREPGSPKAKQPVSKANAVAELVLQTCRAVDTSAHISSVLRDSYGRTVVRIRTDPRNESQRMLRALECMWPLARSSVIENPLDGISEAEITVPREIDERKRAWKRAKHSKCSEFLMLLALVLFFMTVISYGRDCVNARNMGANTTSWSKTYVHEEL